MDKELILTCVIQILLSLVLGFAIGFERKMRYKEAGIRTHTIVCIGACLYMLVSKHGFGGIGDPGRIAAQIVSGIGFIGAGMIFNHKQVVHGLTTAAGIWATAAIGMAVGAEMWIVSLVASVVIILVQFIMHLPFKVFHSRFHLRLNVVFRCDKGDEKEKVKEFFGVKRFTRINAKKEGEQIYYSTIISTGKDITADDIYNALSQNDFIISITREDDEF